MDSIISLTRADITTLTVDAIVNAANTLLLPGGGGVNAAIHRIAGPELLQDCLPLRGCRVGRAKLTRGFGLPANFVIHTVGPVWNGGNRREASLLASCYRETLQLAEEHAFHSIAFPSISTGGHGYPGEEAAQIAVATISWHLTKGSVLRKVILCCRSEEDLQARQTLLAVC